MSCLSLISTGQLIVNDCVRVDMDFQQISLVGAATFLFGVRRLDRFRQLPETSEDLTALLANFERFFAVTSVGWIAALRAKCGIACFLFGIGNCLGNRCTLDTCDG